jgi:hypothetical protein
MYIRQEMLGEVERKAFSHFGIPMMGREDEGGYLLLPLTMFQVCVTPPSPTAPLAGDDSPGCPLRNWRWVSAGSLILG